MENKDQDNNIKNKITEKIKELTKLAKAFLEQNGKVAGAVTAGVAVIVVAIVLSNSFSDKKADDTKVATEEVIQEPLEENAHEDVVNLMTTMYNALASGDIEQIKAIKDYSDDTELITFQKKSEYIESYNNLICYTKKGNQEGSYFVYEYYEVKFFGIDTMAPGLNTWYVYTKDDGSLVIDGDMDDSITAYLKLVTSTDDVVDLFNKVDAKYSEAVESDETLNGFLAELPNQIRTAVGVELASLQESSTEEQVTQEAQEITEGASEEAPAEEPTTEQVKTIDVVNVRKSDSEEADKIGKAAAGLVMTRLETKMNGWSKVIFEGQEAYIKSDFLEVVSTEETAATSTPDTASTGKMLEAQTNVNVRNAANENADKIGVAQAQQKYKVLEELNGGWMKIEYNGQEGFVKSEYFR